MADSFNQLEKKTKQAIQATENKQQEISIIEKYNFDELKMYFGEDYWLTDKICIHQPTIGDILEYGDTDFYSVMQALCANPTTFRLQLWKEGINWNKISDFDLFLKIYKIFNLKNTGLIFGNLNLSWFECIENDDGQNILVYVPRDEHGQLQEITEDELIVIDESLYHKMIAYISLMLNIHSKVEHAKNKATAEAIIWEDEMNLNNQNNDHVHRSYLLPLVSSMVNHPGFKYKTNELKDLGIVQFMDSVKRLQVYENTTALLKGSYSGMMDCSKIDKKQFDWTRSLNDM